MGREIEFRGWDKDTQRWYYGSYVRLERVSGYAWSDDPEAANKRHQSEDFDDYIFFTEMNDWGLETKKLRATVDPKTVGQYTGVRDNDGHKIFEGDIIEWFRRSGGHYYAEKRKRRVVVWEQYNRCVGYNLRPTQNDSNSHWQVIGNIYENGDLLNDKSN